MNLRKILLCALFIQPLLFSTAVAHMKTNSNPSINKLNSIASSYEKNLFDLYPEIATFWGRNDAAQDRFSDHSIAATHAWHKKEDEYLKQLLTLAPKDLKGTPQFITYQLLKQKLESQKDARVCKE